MNLRKWAVLAVISVLVGCGGGSPGHSFGGGGTEAGVFLYAANDGSGNIVFYEVASTGALTVVTGSPLTTGANTRIETTAAEDFLFIAHSNTIVSFSISGTTGALSATTQPATALPGGTSALQRVGNFLYAVNRGANSVSGFTLDPATAALTPVGGSPFTAEFQPFFVAADPQGRFLYVLTESSSGLTPTVIGFAITAITGNLTPVPNSPFALVGTPRAAAVERTGNFLYVTTNTVLGGPAANAITSFTIQPSGELVPLGTLALTATPSAIVAHPTLSVIYVADEANNQVFAFTVNTNGSLTAVTGSPFSVPQQPISLQLSPDGTQLFVGHAGNAGISAMSVNATSGALTLVTGSPFANAGSSPVDLVVVDRR